METLEITGIQMTENCIAQISIMFPNLKHFKIPKGYLERLNKFLDVGPAIWTHLKKLCSLKVVVHGDGPENAFPAFDSCITGFSKKSCSRLYHLIPADKFGSRVKVPQSELEAERKYPSILDLKGNPKNLVIHLENF